MITGESARVEQSASIRSEASYRAALSSLRGLALICRPGRAPTYEQCAAHSRELVHFGVRTGHIAGVGNEPEGQR